MTNRKRNTVVAAFPDTETAERAIQELLQKGFSKGEIGFAVRSSDEPTEMEEAEAQGQAAAVRTVGGAVTGGILGGLLGALASLAIPGFGPLLSAGFLAAAGGAIAGGFTGVMSTLELSDEEVKWYQGELEAGRPIVAVKANDRYSEALAVLQVHGGYDLSRQSV